MPGSPSPLHPHGNISSQESEYRRIAVIALLPSFIWIVLYVMACLQGMPWGKDFPAFYDTAVKIAAHNPIIYDHAMLETYLASTDQIPIGWPFPYPPSMWLLILPLAHFSYTAAFWLWTSFGIISFAFAQGLALKPLLPEWSALSRWKLSLMLSIISPFAVPDIIEGQSGHIFAALLLLAVFQARSRPWLAAVGFALLTLKLQIAALAALILLLTGNIRVLALGGMLALIPVAISAGVWGGAAWQDYIGFIQQFSHSLSIKPDVLQPMTLSVYSTLRLLGASPALATAGYGVMAAIAMASFWRVMRSGVSLKQDISPALLAGGLLLLPYVMWHDVSFLNIASVWLLTQSRRTGFLPGERTALCLILFTAPFWTIMLNVRLANISVLLIVGLYALLWRRLTHRALANVLPGPNCCGAA